MYYIAYIPLKVRVLEIEFGYWCKRFATRTAEHKDVHAGLELLGQSRQELQARRDAYRKELDHLRRVREMNFAVKLSIVNTVLYASVSQCFLYASLLLLLFLWALRRCCLRVQRSLSGTSTLLAPSTQVVLCALYLGGAAGTSRLWMPRWRWPSSSTRLWTLKW